MADRAIPVRRSPLFECRQQQTYGTLPSGDRSAGLTLGERSCGAINLRGSAIDRSFMSAVGSILDGSLPTAANTFLTAAGESASAAEMTTAAWRACWLGPNEWLLLLAAADAAAFAGQLRSALASAGVVGAVTDVSSGHAIITLAGPRARDVLAQGCSLDLHPRAFPPGRCAQTILAKVPVVLIPTGANSFELAVGRSFAEYVWLWLQDAGEAYGVAL